MINNSENSSDAAFEDELFNSLKFYGYLFPESVQQVEIFENLYGKNIVNAPLIEKILLDEKDVSFGGNTDLDIGLAAYSNSENEFPELPNEDPNEEIEE